MKKSFGMLLRLNLGFILCAASTVLMLNSNLGLSPWDVFHEGLANLLGITIGQASILVGFAFVGVGMLCGQKLGIGTILNMILVGQFIDIIIYLGIIPIADNIITGIIMMVIGMLVMGLGCYYYIGCGEGCGPRDGVMLLLSSKLNISIKYVRATMELIVLALGVILGGTVGIATIITAIFLGYSIQLIFQLLKFNVTEVKHRSVFEVIKGYAQNN